MLAFSALPVMAAEGPDAEQTASTQPVTAAAAPLPAAPPRYSAEILSALKHLSALLRKGPLVDQKGLDSLALEISGLDGRITELLGPAIILELKKEEGELLHRAQLAAARAELQDAHLPASPTTATPAANTRDPGRTCPRLHPGRAGTGAALAREDRRPGSDRRDRGRAGGSGHGHGRLALL